MWTLLTRWQANTVAQLLSKIWTIPVSRRIMSRRSRGWKSLKPMRHWVNVLSMMILRTKVRKTMTMKRKRKMMIMMMLARFWLPLKTMAFKKNQASWAKMPIQCRWLLLELRAIHDWKSWGAQTHISHPLHKRLRMKTAIMSRITEASTRRRASKSWPRPSGWNQRKMEKIKFSSILITIK